MFLKTALTFLLVGALSVNALTVPVARSPAPEPDSQELEAWMLKRDLSYDLLSRELQALDELFSREPEDWAERAKRGLPVWVSPPPSRPATPPPPPPPPPPASTPMSRIPPLPPGHPPIRPWAPPR